MKFVRADTSSTELTIAAQIVGMDLKGVWDSEDGGYRVYIIRVQADRFSPKHLLYVGLQKNRGVDEIRSFGKHNVHIVCAEDGVAAFVAKELMALASHYRYMPRAMFDAVIQADDDMDGNVCEESWSKVVNLLKFQAYKENYSEIKRPAEDARDGVY